MKSNSPHIAFARLADLADDRVSADERALAMAHLSDCAVCAHQLARLAQVFELMKTDAAIDAPRDLLAQALTIFHGREDSHESSLLRRIIATLSFDSQSNLAPAFGVRSGQAASRQLLYSAEENDIDLRITPEKDTWIVAGQVLGEDCVGGHIEIEGEGEFVAADFNELCEFRLRPIPAGRYRVRLRLGNAEVEIPQLELRA